MGSALAALAPIRRWLRSVASLPRASSSRTGKVQPTDHIIYKSADLAKWSGETRHGCPPVPFRVTRVLVGPSSARFCRPKICGTYGTSGSRHLAQCGFWWSHDPWSLGTLWMAVALGHLSMSPSIGACLQLGFFWVLVRKDVTVISWALAL